MFQEWSSLYSPIISAVIANPLWLFNFCLINTCMSLALADSRRIMFLSFESAQWFECRWEGKSKYRTFHFRLCYSETMQLPGLVMETLAELAYFLAWAQNLSMFLILALIHQWNHCCMLRDLKDTRYTRHVQNQGFEQVAATLTIGEHGHDFISDTVLLHVKNKAVSLKVANSVG